jgi:uncharacterized protein YbjT (DUF2867 family)
MAEGARDTDRPILVLGGTGSLGRPIVGELARRGEVVRVLSRRPEAARALLGDGPAIVAGDLTDAEAVRRAVEGARAVVLAVSAMAPATFRRARQIERDAVIAALEQAERAGARRAVLISVYEIDVELAERLGIESARIKLEVEQYLGQCKLSGTVLGQPPSMEIFPTMIRAGRFMVVPGGGPPALPTIAARDTAAIAAEAVLRDDLGGRRFRLAGPEAMSFREAARRIGAVYGRPIRFVAIPLALPRLARWLITPLARLSDRIGYVHAMLAYVRLLNAFPPRIAALAAADHQRLRDTFAFTPTTLEDLVRRPRAQRRAAVRP